MGIARVVLLLYYFTNQVRFKTLKHMIIIMYVVPPLRGILNMLLVPTSTRYVVPTSTSNSSSLLTSESPTSHIAYLPKPKFHHPLILLYNSLTLPPRLPHFAYLGLSCVRTARQLTTSSSVFLLAIQ